MSPVCQPGGPSSRSTSLRRSTAQTLLAARLDRVGQRLEISGDERAPMEVLRRVARRFGGRVVFAGDRDLLAEMRSPTDALHCAGALQDALCLERGRFPYEVELRVAVVAGECERRGRELRGAPVAEAWALLDRAAPGEVLFSRAVHLTANRSEVRAAGEAGSVYRLLPPPERPFPTLPFHGLWLRRRAPTAGVRLAETAQALAGGVARAPAFRMAVFAAVAAVVLLRLRPPGPEERVEAALHSGRLHEAALWAEQWAGEVPDDPRAHLWKARAERRLGHPDAARDAMETALRLDPSLAVDEEVAGDMVDLLDAKGADLSLVLRHSSGAVREALVRATTSPSYWQRHNAVRALEKLGLEARIDRVGVALLDLRHERSCRIRMNAARRLASMGAGDPRVLPALEEARRDELPHAICNLRQVIDETIASLAG